MKNKVPDGYMKQSDAIADVLHLYEFDHNDYKCAGLMARVGRAVKACEIDFFVIHEGVRYLHVDPFKKWCKSHIQDLERSKHDENLKLENLRRKNKAALGMVVADTDNLILQMVEPKKKDDWFHVLFDAINEFEDEFGCSPNKQQLWNKLNTKPPHGHEVECVEKHGAAGFQLFGGKHLDKEAFKKRYQRMYPSKDMK